MEEQKTAAKDSKSHKNQILFREHFFAINVCIVDVKKYKNKKEERKENNKMGKYYHDCCMKVE